MIQLINLLSGDHMKIFNIFCQIIILIALNSSLSHASVNEVNRYMGVNLQSHRNETTYRYGEPYKNINLQGIKILSSVYLNKNNSPVNLIFGYQEEKLLTESIICSTWGINGNYERTSFSSTGCNLSLIITTPNSWFNKKPNNYVFLDIGNDEDDVIFKLGLPSQQKVNRNIKDVFYKKYQVYFRYNSGKIIAIGIGKSTNLNIYIYQFENYSSLVKGLFEKAAALEKQKEFMNNLVEDLRDNLRESKERAKQLELSFYLNGIKLNERIDLVLSKLDKPNLGSISGSIVYRVPGLFNESNKRRCKLLKECENGDNALFPGDMDIYPNDNGNVSKIIYACEPLLSYSNLGKFFGKIGCGQNITEFEAQLENGNMFCSPSMGGRFYDIVKFKNLSTGDGIHYHFLTSGNRISHVGLSMESYIPDNYQNCGVFQ
jgi:hypothetical protein